MKRFLLAAIFLVLLAGGYYYRGSFFQTATETRSARPPVAQPVMADVASVTSAPIEVTAIGTVQSMVTVMVKPRVDGEIEQLHFEEGQEVNKGDPLFSLDDRAFRQQLALAEANLERDKAQLQRAQLELTRQTDLASRAAASAQKLDDTKTAAAVLEATVRADDAAVENARVTLNYTKIKAPMSGRTGSVALKQGNIVKANDTSALVTITQLRPIYITFTVPEMYLDELQAAVVEGSLPVVATIPNQPQKPITGVLVFIDNQVDVVTGTISLTAKFSNDDNRLWPGRFVNVTLTLGMQENAVVVPSAAIQIGQNGPYVFVIKQDSTVELRLVQVNRTVNDKTVIDKGITAGERVVVDGQLRLGNGTRVAVQQSGGAKPTARSMPVAERSR